MTFRKPPDFSTGQTPLWWPWGCPKAKEEKSIPMDIEQKRGELGPGTVKPGTSPGSSLLLPVI